MFKLFRKKTISEELDLQGKLADIQNILYANTNAATGQMRSFIELLCKSILIYEGIEYNDEEKVVDIKNEIDKKEEKLVDLIKQIDEMGIFPQGTTKLFNLYRLTGNDATHKYIYPTKEEAAIYYSQLEKIYEEFQIKYEMEYRKYRKELLKKYSREIINIESTNEEDYLLLNGEKVIVPKEKIIEPNLGSYDVIKRKLSSQLEYIEKIYKELNLENENIKITKDKLTNNTFNIVVLGEVNRGKSTLINGLLGNNILPSNILPTTSVITKIVYGENSDAIIEFNNGVKKNITVDKLKNYVTTLQNDNNVKINSTTVYYPNNLCKNNCVLVDTPGVNDIDHRNTEVTYKYIPNADAIIFLVDPDQVFTNSEKVFLKSKVLQHNLNKMFFVLNKADNINESGKRNLRNYIENTLKELNLPCKFYIISSKQALIAKMKEENNEYLQSFLAFEKDIEEFLFYEKGKQIVVNTISRIQSITEECINKIYELNSCSDLKEEELKNIEKDLLDRNKEILKGEGDIFKYIDEDYKILVNRIIDIIYVEMNKSFDSLIERLREEDYINQDRASEMEGFINKSINNWISVRINPILATELNRINSQLINMINEKVKINISSSGLSKHNTQSLVILNSDDIETCYTPSLQSRNEKTFIGVGALLTTLLSGSLLGGVILATIGYMFLSSDNDAQENKPDTKEQLIKNITLKRETIIENIKNEIVNRINKDYENNKRYVEKEITNSINNNINIIKDVNKKLDKNKQDKESFRNELNNILKNMIIIYKQNKNYIMEMN